MKTPSPNYESKLYMARALAALGARAVTITAVARTKSDDSRKIHRQVNGHGSNPGQTPTDPEWLMANRTRRLHAALLLIFYEGWRKTYQSLPDAHGLAFIMAYRDYQRLVPGNQAINPERLNLLVSGFNIGWREITKGGSSKFATDNVRVMNCKKCRLPHLVEAHHITYICPVCC